LLDALTAEPREWRYGYDLCRETGLKSGSVYPILMRLVDRRLLEAKWEERPPPGRPARHLYRLTGAGQAYVADATARRGAPVRAPARPRMVAPRLGTT
jgi:DNA-binding PadR family transcriptional regulator